MTARSVQHRRTRATRVRRVRPIAGGAPMMIHVTLTWSPGISQSFLIMNGSGHRAEVTGRVATPGRYPGWQAVSVPLTVSARVA